MRFRLITSFFFFLVGGSHAVRFCPLEKSEPVSGCLTVENSPSLYTKSIQTRFTISAAFGNRRGWLAFGIGSTMEDSVMFVAYPGRNLDQLTISVRNASGHMPPATGSSLPQIQVQSVTIPEDNLWSVEFSCESCVEGIKGFDIGSHSQSFIWAANTEQLLVTDDVDAPLQFHGHDLFGSVQLDMTQTDTFAEHADTAHHHRGRQILKATHGILAGLSFMVFPIGVYLLKRGGSNAFSAHWATQAFGATLLGLATLFGLWMAMDRNRGNLSAHQILGTCLALVTGTQIVTGTLHHRKFQRTNKKTGFSFAHRWVGRSTIPLGVLNVLLGSRLAGLNYVWFAAYLTVYTLESLAMIVLLARNTFSTSHIAYQGLEDGDFDGAIESLPSDRLSSEGDSIDRSDLGEKLSAFSIE